MSDFVIITMLSVIFYLAFEAPPLFIEDYIYKKVKRKATWSVNDRIECFVTVNFYEIKSLTIVLCDIFHKKTQ